MIAEPTFNMYYAWQKLTWILLGAAMAIFIQFCGDTGDGYTCNSS